MYFIESCRIYYVPYVSLGLPKDELQTAIELSLQESHNAQEEEKEFNRYKRTCFLYNASLFQVTVIGFFNLPLTFMEKRIKMETSRVDTCVFSSSLAHKLPRL